MSERYQATTRMVPIIAVVRDDLIKRLEPLIAQIAATDMPPVLVEFAASCGWTRDMIAWGTILEVLAEDLDVDAIVGPPSTQTQP